MFLLNKLLWSFLDLLHNLATPLILELIWFILYIFSPSLNDLRDPGNRLGEHEFEPQQRQRFIL